MVHKLHLLQNICLKPKQRKAFKMLKGIQNKQIITNAHVSPRHNIFQRKKKRSQMTDNRFRLNV